MRIRVRRPLAAYPVPALSDPPERLLDEVLGEVDITHQEVRRPSQRTRPRVHPLLEVVPHARIHARGACFGWRVRHNRFVELSYGVAGATEVARPSWSPPAGGFRVYERSVFLGTGESVWRDASTAVMAWGVKTRSGFGVQAADGGDVGVRLGVEYTLLARIGPVTVREPVCVVTVVETDDRCGFAYGTGVGHRRLARALPGVAGRAALVPAPLPAGPPAPQATQNSLPSGSRMTTA